MKADYKIGVCFDNKDPKNFGRIRAIPLNRLGRTPTLREIQSYIADEDSNAIATQKYNPWNATVSGSFKEKDEYVCEPFLPKNIAITPKNGQLVKIINYDDLTQKTEYIGPYTVDQITLTDEYRNVVNKLQKDID